MNDMLPQASSPSTASALALLRLDHQQIDRLLDQHDLMAREGGSFADRQGLVARIGALFNALYGVKEQVVYPLLAQRMSPGLVEEAQRDHGLLRQQLQKVAASEAADPSADADMQSFSDQLRAYFAMEEAKLFPHLARLDSTELAEQVAMHRSAELGDQGAD